MAEIKIGLLFKNILFMRRAAQLVVEIVAIGHSRREQYNLENKIVQQFDNFEEKKESFPFSSNVYIHIIFTCLVFATFLALTNFSFCSPDYKFCLCPSRLKKKSLFGRTSR